MPAFSPISFLNTIVNNATANSSTSSIATNATNHTLQVVCAWPVSGQYGPGTRVLYYVLVIACVVARKAEWLRNACLAAALLFPAIAAAHGIVLAALHIDDAVDMDVYGAFQLCSIGILAAPITVRLSQTYFRVPGRNIIFLWTGLILSGLLSLMVEFYRLKPSDCHDKSGNPVSLDASQFDYGNTMCGLVNCTVGGQGPHSPMRGGSSNNIYVIPSPDELTFDTATLLAAACCIPAILSLIFMWIKILEMDSNREEHEQIDEPIGGTNGATTGEMKKVNSKIRFFLGALEVPVYGAAILAILIMGERNFFSSQVRYQTEPIASIGQWGPIVGTGLAALGSLYLLLAADLEAMKKAMKEEANSNASMDHCNCSHSHHEGEEHPGFDTGLNYPPNIRDARTIHGGSDPQDTTSPQDVRIESSHSVNNPDSADARHSLSDGDGGTSIKIMSTISRPGQQGQRPGIPDVGNRRKVANALFTIGNYLGTVAHDQFHNSEFKSGKALDFPEIPGEASRNRALPQIREQYNHSRDEERAVTPDNHSRAGSFISNASGFAGEGSSIASPQSPQSLHSSPTFPSVARNNRPHANTLSVDVRSQSRSPLSFAGATGARPRRDTLEVPSLVRHSFVRNNPSASS